MLRRCRLTRYKYQDFEYSKTAQMPFFYPREAPNTSYFPQFIMGYWTWIGFGKEELWCDKEGRRYETSWQLLRKLLMSFFPCYYFFPWNFPRWLRDGLWGDYGERPFLHTRQPMDAFFIEWGGTTTDAEWVRHIHSRENL